MRLTTAEDAALEVVEADGANALASLTAKQRDVLDLLLEHKTSKEISRILGISPYTVDQRIMLARAKLNVATRNEVAQAYRLLLSQVAAKPPFSREISDPEIYEQSVYGSSHLASGQSDAQVQHRDDTAEGLLALPFRNVAQTIPRPDGPALTEPYYHVLPEVFDGPNGTVLRLGAIALIAMFLVLIVMGGLAMFEQLSHIVDR